MPKLVSRVLHDSTVKALKARATRVDTRDALVRGLILSVLPSGKKQWAIRYRMGGRQRRHVLGDLATLSLADARDRAREALQAVRDGTDVALVRRVERAPRTDTVAALVEAYVAHAEARKKASAGEDARVLRKDIVPVWGDRAAHTITRAEVRAVVAGIVTRGATVMANRTLSIIGRLFSYGLAEDWPHLEGNPASRIAPPTVERSRDRVLTDDELRALWTLLGRFPTTPEKQAPGRKRATHNAAGEPFCPLTPALAAVTKVRLLTGQRGGEIIQMRWYDIDGDWWTIPAAHSKNGQPHRVPITPSLRAVLLQMQERPMAERVFASGGHRLKKAGARLSRALGFTFRSHDLRRTVATRLGAAGVSRDAIAAVLGHTLSGPSVTSVYDRYNRDAEKKKALLRWDRLLKAILTSAPAQATVVPFAR